MTTLICALGLAVPAVAATSTAANATPVPPDCTAWQEYGDWYLPYGCVGETIPASHTCQRLESSYGVTSVDGIAPIECTDIAFNNNNYDNGYNPQGDLWGEGEFYCQASNGYHQCGGMNVNVDMWYNQVGDWSAGFNKTKNYKCNPSPGPACPTPAQGRAMVSTPHGANLYTHVCYYIKTWLPAGNVISIDGTAIHSINQVTTQQLTVCFADPGITNPNA
ncbi:MAG TPA: hypothetical protein VGJ07_09510 [Rugosimonospora sp.]|jgi:hypothetical protein